MRSISIRASSSVMGANSISFTHDLVSGKLVHEAIEVELALGAFALNMVGDLVGGADLLVDDAGLVLAQLTRDLGGGDVDGRVHVLFALFDADDMAFSAR